jgi:hypothetical protein
MPTIRNVEADARSRLRGAGGAAERLQPYIDAIWDLSGDQMIEIGPEDGETLRQVKYRLARASTVSGVAIRSGETQEGTVLVWLAERTQRRGRQAATSAATEEGEPITPQRRRRRSRRRGRA